MKRDLSKAQFEARARKLGFSPQGFMGYWKCPSGVCASVWNAGKRNRDRLRYLIATEKREHDKQLALASPLR